MTTVTPRPVDPFAKAVTEETFSFALMAIGASDEIGVDTETTGLDVRNKRDHAMGICIDVEGWGGYLPFRHKEGNLPFHLLDPLFNTLKDKTLVWHNQKFDYHSLATLGVDPLELKGPQYDCLILASLVNEEWYNKGLDYLSKIILSETKDDKNFYEWGKKLGFENLTVEMTSSRANDAYLTRRLRKPLWDRIVQQELQDVYWDTEQPFLKLLYKLEQRGVGTRADFCSEKAEHGRNRMSTIHRKVGFNPGSSNEIGKYILDELGLPVLAHTSSCPKCGDKVRGRKEPVHNHEWKASFNKVAMDEYDELLQVSNDPTARLVSEYRGWQKAVTSLYEPTLHKVGPDGRLRTNFKQHQTATGRLSSEDPNLQQVPRGSSKPWNGNAKYAFCSGYEGYLLYGWDYSQIELRMSASYGSEALLLAEFAKDKADPFSVLAPLIFGHLDPETRHRTKNGFVYPTLYGAGLAKIAYTLGMTEDEAKPLLDRYRSSIPGITAISRTVNELMASRGWIRYWDGRRRHIRNRDESHKAWNSLLQGGAAQLMKKAMLRCEKFEDENCYMVLTVHDEITFILREDMIDTYEPLVKEAMCDWDFGVNLAIEGKEWK